LAELHSAVPIFPSISILLAAKPGITDDNKSAVTNKAVRSKVVCLFFKEEPTFRMLREGAK
jgi:hypothetical protein